MNKQIYLQVCRPVAQTKFSLGNQFWRFSFSAFAYVNCLKIVVLQKHKAKQSKSKETATIFSRTWMHSNFGSGKW